MSEKNYDPPMHSAEHILNRTMVRMFGTERSFSNHIEKKKSKCDYHFNRSLTSEEETNLEEEVNKIISRNLPIIEMHLPIREAEERFNLSKLPNQDIEMVRVIEIGDYDACPCIGKHVSNTNEIGVFRLVSTSFEDGVLRIRYKLKRPE